MYLDSPLLVQLAKIYKIVDSEEKGTKLFEEYCKDKGIYLDFTKHDDVNYTYSSKETASAYIWFIRGMFYSLIKEM